MTVCNFVRATPTVAIEYTDSVSCTAQLQSHILAPEHLTGYPLYNQQNHSRTGFYLTQPVETSNLARNPSFGVSLGFWSQFNARMSRTNEFAYDSGFSMRLSGSGDTVTAERREYAETEILDFEPDLHYTASMFLWLPRLWDTQDPIMATISIVDFDGTTFEEVFSEQVEDVQKWVRVGVTKKIRATATNVWVRVNLRSQDQQELTPPFNATGFFNLQNEYLYADMLQVEQGSEITLPFHGGTEYLPSSNNQGCRNPFTWVGSPHLSTSHRSMQATNSGRLVSLTDLGFEMLSHSGHDAPSINHLTRKYANKYGSYFDGISISERVITMNGFNCTCSLNELECELFNLGSYILPAVDDCGPQQFLLVYHQEECNDLCDSDRDLAIYVTYLGGFEYTRDSLYRQNIVLQLVAYDPVSWFTWPGHNSIGLNPYQTVTGNRILKIEKSGNGVGFGVPAGTNVTQAACLGDLFVYGTDDGLSLSDCGEGCESPDYGFGNINDIEILGNNEGFLFATENGPAQMLSTGIIKFFSDGYGGGEALSIYQPDWAQVVVGSNMGIYILTQDGQWIEFVTDGAVLDLIADNSGILYAVGEFTQIGGEDIVSAAKFNPFIEDCFQLDGIVWESIGYTFNDALNTLAHNRTTNIVYFGGDATIATPNPTDTCFLSEGIVQQSTGGNQEMELNLVGNQMTLTMRTNSNVFFFALNHCVNGQADDRYFRITAANNIGASYTYTIGAHQNVIYTYAGFDGTHFVGSITWDMDNIGQPCTALNRSFADEITSTNAFAEVWEQIELVPGGGNGLDNRITRFTVQCISLSQSFTGSSVTINRVFGYDGQNVLQLGEGLPSTVNTLTVNQDTGELWAGYNEGGLHDGLSIWNDLTWTQFYGFLHGPGYSNILDLHFCESDCSMIIVSDSDGTSLIAGHTQINYNGDFETLESELVVQGNGTLQYLSQAGDGCDTKTANLCATVPCNSLGAISFGQSVIQRQNKYLNNGLLPGSRLDFWLSSDYPQYYNVFITDPDSETNATLLWQDHYWGINAICCSNRLNGRYLPGGVTSIDLANDNCCSLHFDIRNPTNQDCIDNGYTGGSTWVNNFGNCTNIFVKIGDEPCNNDCEENDTIGDGDSYITDGDGGEIVSPC